MFLDASEAQGQLPVIGLRSLSQSFFVPGGNYEVGIADGAHTEEVRALLFSHSGLSARIINDSAKPFAISGSPRYGSFRVAVSSDTPEGRYEVRAVGRFGISNPRSVLIRKGIQFVTENGHDVSTANPIDLGVIHCRQVSSQKRDFYSLSVASGQEYELCLISQAIDSRLIGAVSVVDSKGRTLHSAIGSDEADLRLSFTAEEDSTLMLVIHDALYRGGPAYQYGLKVIEGTDRTPQDWIRFPKSITVQHSPEATAVGNEGPIKLVVPTVLQAMFDSPGDVDQYLCTLGKADPVLIEVVSDRIGQPTDARLVIDRAIDVASGERTWQRVATGDDSQNLTDSVVRLSTSDPVLWFQPPEDGTYRISVADLDNGQSLGETQRYQLSIGPPQNDWRLVAYQTYPHKDAKASRPSGSLIAAGGAIAIRVFVIRRGMSAPIKVSIPQLPDGLVCHPAWIAANQDQVDLVITADEHVKSARHDLAITCEATVGNELQSRLVRAAAVIWENDGYRPAIKTRLIDRLTIATSSIDIYPISVGPSQPGDVSAKIGTKVKVKLKVVRRDGGKGSMVLRARNLPPGVKAGDLTIAGDTSEAEWTIEVTSKSKPGIYTFWGQGETKVKLSVNPQALDRATEYRDHLKSLRGDESRSAEHAEIDSAIMAAEKQIEATQKRTAAKEFNVYVTSSPITLNIE